MIPDDPALNPYASPKGASNQNLPMEPWLGTYNPVVMPRDAVDVILGGSTGVLVSAFLYGIPFGVLLFLRAPIWCFVVATFVIVGIAVLAMLVGIRRVELTQDGIIATRPLLSPLRIPWNQDRSVGIANRGTVVLATVFLPHRCCSYSLTSRDQVRIDAGPVRILFPPHDSATFQATARLLAAQHNPNV